MTGNRTAVRYVLEYISGSSFSLEIFLQKEPDDRGVPSGNAFLDFFYKILIRRSLVLGMTEWYHKCIKTINTLAIESISVMGVNL